MVREREETEGFETSRSESDPQTGSGRSGRCIVTSVQCVCGDER